MKTRLFLFSVALATLMLCGCRGYYYTFDTVISKNGSVKRTIHFDQARRAAVEPVPVEEGNTEQAELPEEEPAPEAIEIEPLDAEPQDEDSSSEDAEPVEEHYEFPSTLVIPDRERFDSFELLDGELSGTWRSDGTIHSDFLDMTPSFNPRKGPPGEPRTPYFVRLAYNEGRVTVRDLVLVKAIHYTETFHDYYTREEFEEYGDMVVEILANLFLDILHEDFAGEYDFQAFDDLMTETLVPFGKKWKLLYCREAVDSSEDDRSGISLRSLCLSFEKLAFAFDLMRLGITDDFDVDFFELDLDCREWALVKMHELVKRRDDGTPWPKEEIEAYFGEPPGLEGSPFMETAHRLLAKRYGGEPIDGGYLTDDYFGPHLGNIFSSFAFTADHHVFEVSVKIPGTIVRKTPRPSLIERGRRSTTVEWEFDQVDFFPDSVHLSCTAALPIKRAQKRLFRKVALDDPKDMGRYIALLERLPDETRDAYLATLRECVKKRSLKKLEAFADEHFPEQPGRRTREERLVRNLTELLLRLAAPE